MPATGRIYYIVGAGIAGLTLALSLAKAGTTAVVLERASAMSEFGAGLQISPNARRLLDNLGLGRAIAQRSFEPAGIDLYPPHSRAPLMTLELGAAMRERFGAPYAVMHRADLADILQHACQQLGTVDLAFGTRDWDAVSHARGVTLTLDESRGGARTVRGHALIGADGVHSLTRRRLLQGPDARALGRVAWRTLVHMPRLEGVLSSDRVSVLFGSNHHVVCYPLPHRGQVNIALFTAVPNEENTTAPRLGTRDKRLGSILDAAGESWTPWPLYTVAAPNWHRGNIGIIGDAAHAMVPFQAQGAAMAIEDAAVLAPLLAEEPQAETAFVRFESLRRQRVERVARQSRQNGTIFHLPWPAALARNMVIKAQGPRGHIDRLDWLYGYDQVLEAPQTGSGPTA